MLAGTASSISIYARKTGRFWNKRLWSPGIIPGLHKRLFQKRPVLRAYIDMLLAVPASIRDHTLVVVTNGLLSLLPGRQFGISAEIAAVQLLDDALPCVVKITSIVCKQD